MAAVRDGAAALAHLRSHPVDVVLLDRKMPGMDGLEVLAEIRADPELAAVSVVLVTGVDGTARAIEGLDTGAGLLARRHVPATRRPAASTERDEWEARIHQLVRDRTFRCVFQPIVDLATGDVVGHEALTRFEAGLDPAEVFGTAAKRALVAGLQGFAIETGAALIAEGVETQGQLDAICDLGIAYGQGYLLGRPGDL